MKKIIISLIIIFAVLGAFALSCYAVTTSDYTTTVVYNNDNTRSIHIELNDMSTALWRSFYQGRQTKTSSNTDTFTFPTGFTDLFYCSPVLSRQPTRLFDDVTANSVVVTFKFDLPVFANLGRPSFDDIYIELLSFDTSSGGSSISQKFISGQLSPYVPGESEFYATFTLPISSIDGSYFTTRCTFDFSSSVEWYGVTCTLENFYYEYDESLMYLLLNESSQYVAENSAYQSELSRIDSDISSYDVEVSGILASIPEPSEVSGLFDITDYDFTDFNNFWGSSNLSSFLALFGVLGSSALSLVLIRKLIVG